MNFSVSFRRFWKTKFLQRNSFRLFESLKMMSRVLPTTGHCRKDACFGCDLRSEQCAAMGNNHHRKALTTLRKGGWYDPERQFSSLSEISIGAESFKRGKIRWEPRLRGHGQRGKWRNCYDRVGCRKKKNGNLPSADISTVKSPPTLAKKSRELRQMRGKGGGNECKFHPLSPNEWKACPMKNGFSQTDEALRT